MTDPSNGILAKVDSHNISGAAKHLPAAGPGQPGTMTVDVLAGEMGPVRLTFELMCHKRRQDRHWFWTACHAVRLADDSTCVAVQEFDWRCKSTGIFQ